MSTAYQKMKTLCINLRNEIYTDIQIHNQNILPRYYLFQGLHFVVCILFWYNFYVGYVYNFSSLIVPICKYVMLCYVHLF